MSALHMLLKDPRSKTIARRLISGPFEGLEHATRGVQKLMTAVLLRMIAEELAENNTAELDSE